MRSFRRAVAGERFRCISEVTSHLTKANADGVFTEQNYRVWDLFRAHNSMIRGHFNLGMVWSEVTSAWGWYGQRSLRPGDAMIRGDFGLGMIWPEVTSGWEWSDQGRIQSHKYLIRDHFELKSFLIIFFTERCWLCQEATKSSILITDTSRVCCFWSETKGVQLRKHASPLTKNFCLTVEYDVLYGKLFKFIHCFRNVH